MKALKEFLSIYTSRVELPLWGFLSVITGIGLALGGTLLLTVFYPVKNPIEPAPVKWGVIAGVGLILYLMGMWRSTFKKIKKQRREKNHEEDLNRNPGGGASDNAAGPGGV
jgi:hypothetical protein